MGLSFKMGATILCPMLSYCKLTKCSPSKPLDFSCFRRVCLCLGLHSIWCIILTYLLFLQLQLDTEGSWSVGLASLSVVPKATCVHLFIQIHIWAHWWASAWEFTPGCHWPLLQARFRPLCLPAVYSGRGAGHQSHCCWHLHHLWLRLEPPERPAGIDHQNALEWDYVDERASHCWHVKYNWKVWLHLLRRQQGSCAWKEASITANTFSIIIIIHSSHIWKFTSFYCVLC